jgi:Glycosyltransferase family 87
MKSYAKPDAIPLAGRIFTADRLFAYPLIFVTVYVIASIAWLCVSRDMLDPRAMPLGYDFITFWAGSWLSLHDIPAAVYDPKTIFAAEQIAVHASDKMFLWHYPPTFLLIVTPLALLPYLTAYFLWVAVTFAPYALVIRKMAPQPQTLLLLVAFPGTFLNLTHGQTGFIAAALLGSALMMLERRPILAGILIGLMSFKPHLGVLLPIVLICGRHWQTLAAAAVTTAAFAAVSILFLGVEPWIAFWHNLPVARSVFENGLVDWSKMPTVYAALRLAGAGMATAYFVHSLVAVSVAATVGWVWWRKPSLALRAAVLVSGALLVTPYLFNYDYALLAVPLALLGMDGYVRGWLSYERAVLATAWAMPLIASGIAVATTVQIGPLCVGALFIVAARRALISAPSRPGHRSQSAYTGNAA